jgi:hypothetical protein
MSKPVPFASRPVISVCFRGAPWIDQVSHRRQRPWHGLRPRSFLQIDAGQVTLARRFGWSGPRYSGGGLTLMISKAGEVAIRHAHRPATACESLENKGPER